MTQPLQNEYIRLDENQYGFVARGDNLPTLPTGVWNIFTSMGQVYFRKSVIAPADQFIPLPDESAGKTLSLASKFMSGGFREPMQKLGLMHKMACLLWGAPGTSKSMTIYQATQLALENNWLVFSNPAPSLLVRVFPEIRAREPNRGILVIWEEFEEKFDEWEETILQLLDGPYQTNDVLYMMTTNNIKEVPERILMRCRRIPFQVQFGLPTPDVRRAYFLAKVDPATLETIDLNDWVLRTEGFSLDQCSQLILAVLAFDRTLDDVIEDLNQRKAALKG